MSPDRLALGIPGLANPEVIGRGGFGTVYRVDEPEFGRQVAVKVLHERATGDAVRRAFTRECQAMGALSGHPHIVTVHRGGTTDNGASYIVMDLLTAGSLADRAAREGPLPWADALEIGVQVAGALETAHRAGILHLDLKPANVLVSRYGEPKLGDFGISRMPGVAETTDDGRIRASAAYTAPERLLDGTATPAADLYSLGATLFSLLAGAPAFVGSTGDDLLATLTRIVHDPVPDLRPRGVPDAVCRVVEQLMAKRPAGRYGTAAEAAAALQAAQRATGLPVTRPVVEGEPPAADAAFGRPPGGPVAPPRPPVQPWLPAGAVPPPPVPPPARAAAPAGRTRRLVLAAVAGVLVLALAATGAVLALRPRPTGVGSLAGGGTTPAAAPAASALPTAAPPPAAGPPSRAGLLPPAGDVVAMAPEVDHPQAADARTTLREFVTAINETRYADAFALFTEDSETYRGGLDAWADGQASTVIVSPTITGVRGTGPDTLEVLASFTSFQDAEHGPDGQQCTHWELAYELAGPGPEWLIRRARAVTPPQAC